MNRAFTLLELVVTLAVIAVLTHLATRELYRLRESKSQEKVVELMDNIAAAIYSDDISSEATGFLADMGRLPRAVDGTLSELWLSPTNGYFYALKRASYDNLVEGAKGLENHSVYVPTGWRGPYLKLPRRTSRLYDPWGNKLEVVDEAGLERLVLTNAEVVAAISYGANNKKLEAEIFSLLPSQGAKSTLVIQPISESGQSIGQLISYYWYGPADGLITGALEKATYPMGVKFEGLTPGRRVIYDSCSSVPRIVDVKPGDNLINIKMP